MFVSINPCLSPKRTAKLLQGNNREVTRVESTGSVRVALQVATKGAPQRSLCCQQLKLLIAIYIYTSRAKSSRTYVADLQKFGYAPSQVGPSHLDFRWCCYELHSRFRHSSHCSYSAVYLISTITVTNPTFRNPFSARTQSVLGTLVGV